MSQHIGVFKKKNSLAVGINKQDQESKSGKLKVVPKTDPQKQILKIADKLKEKILKTTNGIY